ncbi:MAG: DNA polymerase III subunit gamma/tau [Patescibacteria group bacterium]
MADNQALYRRWRPQTFADLIGQNHIKQTILNAIKTGKVSHAYLFAGPRGTGKTSLARLLAKAVNCSDNKEGEPCGKCANCSALSSGRMIDLIEIDAASHTSVDDVRNLIEKVNYAPSIARYKVYIIDEVHMLSRSAFNALLKTLEEPPAHAIFILATTEVHKLPSTVVSRCQYFDFHYLSHAELTEQLKKIAQQEKIKIDEAALVTIADNSEGSMRDAISLMDQAASFTSGKVDQQVLKDLLGVVDTQVARTLTQAVLDQDAPAGINLINEVYFKGYDINQVGKLWLNYLRELLMIKLGNGQLVQKSVDEKKEMARQSAVLTISELINLLQRLVEAMNQYRVVSLPQLALELVVAKSCGGVDSKPTVPASSETTAEKRTISGLAPTVSSAASPTLVKEVALTEDNFAEISAQICQGISSVSPSLGAILKTCQFTFNSGKMCIKVPSKFLQDTLDKAANRELFARQLVQAGIGDIIVEYVVEPVANTVTEVAQVFDIM